MKRFLSVLVAFVLVLSLCSCAEKPVGETNETADENIMASDGMIIDSINVSSAETTVVNTTANTTETTTSNDLEGMPEFAIDYFEDMMAMQENMYHSDFYGEEDFRADRPQSDHLYYFESHDDQEIYTSGDYEYYILKDGSAALRNYTGKSTHVKVPSTIDGRQVKLLSATFSDNYFIREVEIPDTVESIKDTFADCYMLKKVIIPESVIYIGSGAFSSCYSLEEITLPSKVIGIESSTFLDCHRLKKINLENIRYIGSAAFMCTALEEITIPENVEYIGRLAFYACRHLKKVNFNDKLICIDNEAFNDCRNLSSLEIPDSVKEIRDYAFINCNKLTTVTCPADVVHLGEKVFSNNDKMTLKVVPNTMFEEYAKSNNYKYSY